MMKTNLNGSSNERFFWALISPADDLTQIEILNLQRATRTSTSNLWRDFLQPSDEAYKFQYAERQMKTNNSFVDERVLQWLSLKTRRES